MSTAVETLHSLEGLLFKVHYDRITFQKAVDARNTAVFHNFDRLAMVSGVSASMDDFEDEYLLLFKRLASFKVLSYDEVPSPRAGVLDMLKDQVIVAMDVAVRLREDNVSPTAHMANFDGCSVRVEAVDTRRLLDDLATTVVTTILAPVLQRLTDLNTLITRSADHFGVSAKDIEQIKVKEVMNMEPIKASCATRQLCIKYCRAFNDSP
jgi:hypothetical protein